MVGMGLSAQNTGKITAAIDRMMQQFPETQLRDLYKSFFQDRFGLEHLMSDSAKADEYLRYELAHLENENLYPDYEPTGYKENFYRVNLHLIRSGKIPYDVYFQAFMESAKAFSPISIEKWEKEWNAIESIIADHYRFGRIERMFGNKLQQELLLRLPDPMIGGQEDVVKKLRKPRERKLGPREDRLGI